jgi:hypothetical protein
MAVLEYRANGDGEGLFTIRTPAQSGACLRFWVGIDSGELGLVIALAMRANDAVRPKDGFEMFAGLVVPKRSKSWIKVKSFGASFVFMPPKYPKTYFMSSA